MHGLVFILVNSLFIQLLPPAVTSNKASFDCCSVAKGCWIDEREITCHLVKLSM